MEPEHFSGPMTCLLLKTAPFEYKVLGLSPSRVSIICRCVELDVFVYSCSLAYIQNRGFFKASIYDFLALGCV